jgi:hypothetical protein
MQKAGKGPEAIPMSMMLVQAMFTLALELAASKCSDACCRK